MCVHKCVLYVWRMFVCVCYVCGVWCVCLVYVCVPCDLPSVCTTQSVSVSSHVRRDASDAGAASDSVAVEPSCTRVLHVVGHGARVSDPCSRHNSPHFLQWVSAGRI